MRALVTLPAANRGHGLDGELRLSRNVTFRVAGVDQLEFQVGPHRGTVPTDVGRFLLEFSVPRSPARMLEGLETDMTLADLGEIVEHYTRLGVLVSAGTPEPPARVDAAQGSPSRSLDSVLNPAIWKDESSLEKISGVLRAGDVCVIADAFEPEYAESMFRCLDEFTDWRPYEGFLSFFHYQHHNIYDRATFPERLAACGALFGSPGTKALMNRLTGRDCDGELQFSASQYLPGDHSLPHTDARKPRSVSFVWHLAKDWRSEWGGNFVWCSPTVQLVPRFNTLILFNVSPSSSHFVSQVSPYAKGKRISVNGWWSSQRQDESDIWVAQRGDRPDAYYYPESAFVGLDDKHLSAIRR